MMEDKRFFIILGILVCLMVLGTIQGRNELIGKYEKVLYQVEHSLDHGKSWTRKGTVVQSHGQSSRNVRFVLLSTEEKYWEESVLEQLKDEKMTKEYPLYQLRLVKEGEESEPIITSTLKCHLIKMKFKEYLILKTMNDRASFEMNREKDGLNVVSAEHFIPSNMRFLASDNSRNINSVSNTLQCSLNFPTKKVPYTVLVKTRASTPMESVSNQYLQQQKQQEEQKKKQEEEPSFFRKYWMYIAIGAVILIGSSLTAPVEEQGGARAT